MLFNSYEFIFFFLPVTLFVFFTIGKRGYISLAMAWLVAASLFFYAWWNPAYLSLMIISILFNYIIGRSLSQHIQHPKILRLTLIAGITINLSFLAYFKYANFFIDNTNQFLNTHMDIGTILLPLAISFFTFQQIAYLVDAYRGETREYNFLHYCLFVTFFPQLIAGPIVHHKEMMPQFAKKNICLIKYSNLAIGLSIFAIGLFKKVVLADGIAIYASPVFDSAAIGVAPGFADAWVASLSYTLQLYFDFSGYCDMAIGVARMFGIKLPLNFHSPYKAVNIIDFWRRWHMTLSRFLRDYLYFPLGGNRKGPVRRYFNLLLTMVLGGLWHGAGWTFILWGALHGLFLIVNHGWHAMRRHMGHDLSRQSHLGMFFSRLITFLAVVLAWVFFRAETFSAAMLIIQGMFGLHTSNMTMPMDSLSYIAILLTIIWFAPNTQEWLSHYHPAFNYPGKQKVILPRGVPSWRATRRTAILMAFSAFISILYLTRDSEFLYFNF